MGKEDNYQLGVRKLIGKAWADPEFKAQLLQDPKRHLGEAGLLEAAILADPNRTVRIVEDAGDMKEDTFNVLHFLLPARPTLGAELTDDQLQRATEIFIGPNPKPSNPSTCCCDISVAPSVFD